MANEIQIPLPSLPTNAYVLLVDALGKFWNTTGTPAFEAYTEANWDDYAITLTRQGTSLLYFATMPAGVLTSGVYNLYVFERAGATPAVTDTFLGNESNFFWSKGVRQYLSGIATLFWESQINGTAQGGTSTTITLAASASANNDDYNRMAIEITGGTGVGQVRKIDDYVGSTKVATVSEAWVTTPDSTSTYVLMGRIE